jgi:competence protein ComGC
MDGRITVTSALQREQLSSSEWMPYKGQATSEQARVVQQWWWYRLTTPARPLRVAASLQREMTLRSRIASLFLFFLLALLVFCVLPIALLVDNRIILLFACLLLALTLIAVLFNRAGSFQVAGALVACGIAGVFYTCILTNPAGLTIDSLLLFNGPILAELFIASLLPGSWLFLATLLNSLFIVTAFMMIPETSELAQIMQTKAYPVIMCLVVLHSIVSGVVWLWVHHACQANERADQAEETAAIQRMVAEQEHTIALQKHLLDSSINQIMCTHVQIANGNLAARVPVHETPALQPLAVALNNLLNRLQRLRQIEQEFLSLLPHLQKGKLAEYELQRVKYDLDLLLHALHESRQSNRCMHMPRTGSLLDPLFQEMNGRYLSLLPPGGKSTTTQLPAADYLLSNEIT